jgi:ureidoglycolate hydrolase
MDKDVLEILDYDGVGYQPLIDFGAWRVAFLRWIDSILPDRIDYMERHAETDEVFVLLHGQAVLFLGGRGAQVVTIEAQLMEPCKLYNVKQNSWHSISMSRDTTILLVENRDTSEANSQYWQLTDSQRAMIREFSFDKLKL